jgi:hypothetical protein
MNILRWIFSSEAPRQIQHPVFGQAIFFRSKGGGYWEADIARGDEQFTVIFEAPDESAPTDRQVSFFQQFFENHALAFDAAAPLLVPEYEKWCRRAFPASWRDAFKFVGMTVPADGNPESPWDLSFDCLHDTAGHQFTCYFENSKPTSVSIDG